MTARENNKRNMKNLLKLNFFLLLLFHLSSASLSSSATHHVEKIKIYFFLLHLECYDDDDYYCG